MFFVLPKKSLIAIAFVMTSVLAGQAAIAATTTEKADIGSTSTAATSAATSTSSSEPTSTQATSTPTSGVVGPTDGSGQDILSNPGIDFIPQTSAESGNAIVPAPITPSKRQGKSATSSSGKSEATTTPTSTAALSASNESYQTSYSYEDIKGLDSQMTWMLIAVAVVSALTGIILATAKKRTNQIVNR